MGKGRILVVEDDHIIALEIEERLRDFGYEVTGRVSTGEDALVAVEREKPDLVLMDIRLKSQMSGLEAAKTIHNHQGPPVVYLTAHADSETLAKAKITEPFGYILKPFDERTLRTSVEMALYKHQMESRLKKKQGELEAEKERLSVTLSSIGEGVISTDMDGKVFLVNKVAEKLTGWSQKEAKGRFLNEIFVVTKEDTFGSEMYACPIEWTTGPGEDRPVNVCLKLLDRQGKHRIISQSISPIFDSGRQIVGTVVVFKDITEERRLERELQKMEKLESLSVLAGGIAHDFNNMLTGILGNISLAKFNSGEDNTPLLEETERAIVRITDLTRQLLTFSKGGEPIKKLVSIPEFIRETASFALRGSKVKSEIAISENIWAVSIDRSQLSQVMNNLLLNADQAMPEGGKVTITAKNNRIGAKSALPLPPGYYVQICVSDRGTGIRREHLSRIFDPFFTTKQKGSGLGLATTYSIIRNHGGHITATSQVGVGTTFCFYLPATESKAADQEVTEQVPTGKGEKILIMDDETTVGKILSQMLQRLGYETTWVDNGQDAVTRYESALDRKEPYDCVILDLTVRGGMGGVETMKKLLQIDPGVVAIMASGYSTDPVMASYKDYGFREVMVKPFKIEGLSRLIRKVIDER